MSANWFIALPVCLPWSPEGVAPTPPACVRFFAGEDLHITVAFLGPVSPELAGAAFEAASDFPLPPITISLGPIKALGPKHRPSAFSAVLDQGRPEVEQAIGSVRDRLCDLAHAPRDTRPPLAHITLARPRRSAPQQARAEAVRWAESLALPPATARLTQLALYTGSADRAQTQFRIERARNLASTQESQ